MMTTVVVRTAMAKPMTEAYHRRLMCCCCCILAGEMDGGGLAMVMPVTGLMIGMAFRARVAAG